jgi:hypothetical protein
MDQARDMLDIREIVVGLHPRLIGPTTSINGVFLGPFWYYFNVPPFILGSGHPAFLVYWMIFWYLLAGFLLFHLNKKANLTFALISSTIFLMTPALFFSSRFSWSANPMPVMTVFFFLALIKSLNKPALKKSLLSGLIAGLSMQIEAAFGVLFFPFLVICYLIYRVKFKYLLHGALAFFLTLFPQILFELRHNFIMTHTFLKELGGESAILGERLSLGEIFLNHVRSFTAITGGLSDFNNFLTQSILLISLGFLLFRVYKKSTDKVIKDYFLVSGIFLIWAFVFYMFYPFPLKGWYLLGLFAPYIFLISAFLTDLAGFKKIWLNLAIIILLLFSFAYTISNQIKYIPKPTDRSTDQSTLRNEMEVIDWVYQKSNAQAFKSYNYIPSVYDFPYQYMYWWHGTKTYGYQPDTLTYLGNVPEYIPNNERFLDKKKKATDESPIFLILEPDNENPTRRAAWLGNFEKYCLVESHKFIWNTEIQVKRVCQK